MESGRPQILCQSRQTQRDGADHLLKSETEKRNKNERMEMRQKSDVVLRFGGLKNVHIRYVHKIIR